MSRTLLDLFVVSLAFAFFIMCPRMAGMGAIVSRLHGFNPYIVAAIGGVLAIPLIILMEFLVIRFGVSTAIIVAAATDIASAILMGVYKPRYAVEVFIIAAFLWLGVLTAMKLSPIITKILRLE
jgi:hypothetical protein